MTDFRRNNGITYWATHQLNTTTHFHTKPEQEIQAFAIKRLLLELAKYPDKRRHCTARYFSRMVSGCCLDFKPTQALRAVIDHIYELGTDYKDSMFRTMLRNIATMDLTRKSLFKLVNELSLDSLTEDEKEILWEAMDSINWALNYKRRLNYMNEPIELTPAIKARLEAKINEYIENNDMRKLYTLEKDLVLNYSVDAFNWAMVNIQHTTWRKKMKEREAYGSI